MTEAGRAVAREGFIPIRCRSCGGTVMAPLGPDFWDAASAGAVRSRHGIHCACGHVIWQIGAGDIATCGAHLGFGPDGFPLLCGEPRSHEPPCVAETMWLE